LAHSETLAGEREVVEDHMHDFAGRDLILDGIEEAMNSCCRGRCMSRPITVPSRPLKAATSGVVSFRS